MKQSGVLLPIFSLPGKFGIGTLGKGARDFLDAILAGGFSLWQTLPFGPPDAYRSPYAAISSFAGDPAYLDPEELYCLELISREELLSLCMPETAEVNASALSVRMPVLRRAAERVERVLLEDFLHRNPETAAYCRSRAEGGSELFFEAFLQYEFDREWQGLLSYAHRIGVSLMGDLPIYPSADSTDLRLYPEAFLLDGCGLPLGVAGVPPDSFSAEGQIWGNPLYRWDAMREDGFRYLSLRFRYLLDRFDALRLDHFRGYHSYYRIPRGEGAASGHWERSFGEELFEILAPLMEGKCIVAEDLGTSPELTDPLRRRFGFLSTRPLAFANPEDATDRYLPENCSGDCAVYTGTHDNLPYAALLATMDEAKRRALAARLGAEAGEPLVAAAIRALLHSAAALAVFPLADLLFLGEEARVNTPGTVGKNWRWRATSCDLARLDTAGYCRQNRESGRI